MAELEYRVKKTGRQFLFQVKLNWLEENLAVLEAADVKGKLHTALSKKFGGKGNEWSAEHLLLSALSSSFMSTYLAFAKKMPVATAHFDCSTIGQVQVVNNKYKLTHINLYPKIYIVDKTGKDKALLALKKAEQNCLIANSLNVSIIYHSEIITGEEQQDKQAAGKPIQLLN
jgi:organic hydroperoxide reductase OsmC/OhrA